MAGGGGRKGLAGRLFPKVAGVSNLLLPEDLGKLPGSCHRFFLHILDKH